MIQNWTVSPTDADVVPGSIEAIRSPDVGGSVSVSVSGVSVSGVSVSGVSVSVSGVPVSGVSVSGVGVQSLLPLPLVYVDPLIVT